MIHEDLKALYELIDDLIDSGEKQILVLTKPNGEWKVRVPLEDCIDYHRIEEFNDYCLNHKVEWLIELDLPDLFLTLSPFIPKEEA